MCCKIRNWITFDFLSRNPDLSFEVRLLQWWWLKDVDGRKATMASILVTRMSWDLPPSAGGATHTYTLTTHLTLERKRGGVFGKNDTVSAEKRKGNCKLYSPLPITLSPSTLLYTAHPYNPFPPPSPSINYQTLSLLIKSHIFGPCYKIYLKVREQYLQLHECIWCSKFGGPVCVCDNMVIGVFTEHCSADICSSVPSPNVPNGIFSLCW